MASTAFTDQTAGEHARAELPHLLHTQRQELEGNAPSPAFCDPGTLRQVPAEAGSSLRQMPNCWRLETGDWLRSTRDLEWI